MDFEKLAQEALFDQVSKGAGDVGAMVAKYHASLTRAGMDDFDALELTKAFLAELFKDARIRAGVVLGSTEEADDE